MLKRHIGSNIIESVLNLNGSNGTSSTVSPCYNESLPDFTGARPGLANAGHCKEAPKELLETL